MAIKITRYNPHVIISAGISELIRTKRQDEVKKFYYDMTHADYDMLLVKLQQWFPKTKIKIEY